MPVTYLLIKGILSIYRNVIEMRNRHKDAFLKKHNIKLGFMSAFVKATSYALQDQPVVNAGRIMLNIVIYETLYTSRMNFFLQILN